MTAGRFLTALTTRRVLAGTALTAAVLSTGGCVTRDAVALAPRPPASATPSGSAAPSGTRSSHGASSSHGTRSSLGTRSSYGTPSSRQQSGGTSSRGENALAALAGLQVKGRAAMTGYSREQFGPAWTDDTSAPDGHNGCDTRNDILRRDLTDITVRADTDGCVVSSGVLHDPYTGATISFTRGYETSWQVQIDHVVALGDAWQTGAQQLPYATRERLANDQLQLLAVDASSNERKGDADAASWLPPDHAFRCDYVARQVAVKRAYHLWVTPAEKAAIGHVLASCPGQRLPTDPATTG